MCIMKLYNKVCCVRLDQRVSYKIGASSINIVIVVVGSSGGGSSSSSSSSSSRWWW